MSKNNNHNNPPVNIKNRRATFDYEIVETYTAGLSSQAPKSSRYDRVSVA